MAEQGIAARVVGRWKQALNDLEMGTDGMFGVELNCVRCGRKLGKNPAEIYAGTFNGLCYPCTGAGPYVAEVATLDGCRKVSWPPHCPSWRRDREVHYGYLDCGNCKGMGATGEHNMWKSARYCEACLNRYVNHPLRAMDERYRKLLQETAQATFTRLLLRAEGVTPKASRKARQAALEAQDPCLTAYIRQEVLGRYARLEALRQARAARLQLSTWRAPRPEEVLAA